MLFGSGIFPTHVQVGEQSVTLGTAVRRAFKDSGLSVAAWNDLSELERDCGILLAVHAMKSERALAQRVSTHPEQPVSTHVEPGRAVYVPHEDLPTK